MIEGLRLNEKHSAKEVSDLVNAGRFLRELLERERGKALERGKIFPAFQLLHEGTIKELHELLGQNVESNNAWTLSSTTILTGRYRWADTYWGLHLYPVASEVPRLMDSFLNWFHRELLDLDGIYQQALDDKAIPQSGGRDHPAILLAAKAYNRFIEIHPFEDGNGRTATLIANYILLRYGYPPYIPAVENLKQLARIGRFGAFNYDLLFRPYFFWGETQPVDEERAAFFADQILERGKAKGASLGAENFSGEETLADELKAPTGNFRQFILNLTDEKYGTSFSSARADGQAAIEFFFRPGADRREILKTLEAFLTATLDAYAEALKLEGRNVLPDFETLAKGILFNGLDREKIAATLKNLKPDLTDENIHSALADIEGALGNAVITASALQSSRGGEGITAMMQRFAAAPAEYLKAFNRLAEGWNLQGALFSGEGFPAIAESSLMLAVHVESLPQELQPAFAHALLRRLGEKGTLFLIYPRKPGTEERIRTFTGFLTPQEKARVILRPYVEGAPLPFSTVASRMRQAGPGVGRAVVIPAFEEGMPGFFERSGPVNFFEFSANGVPGNIPDMVFSLILTGGGNSELLKNMPPDILAQRPVGGQGYLFAFNLVALAASLGDEIKQLRAIEQAA